MFRLLGPLDIAAGDVAIAPATAKARRMLAVLLLECNQPVAFDHLAAELWGDAPPISAVANLRTYASGLRADLVRAGHPAERLATVRKGYRLDVAAGERDLDLFEDLADRGDDALRRRNVAEASALLSQALALWRGPALADIDDFGAVLSARVDGLNERRLTVYESLVEARALLGDGAAVVAGLREHLAAHPLRERPHAQLMRLLYADGDSAGALAVYQQARKVLDAELGLSPGPELRRLQQVILRRAPMTEVTPNVLVPRQLPADPGSLVGRRAELAALLDGDSPRVRLVHGIGGVGKSALVIHAAHQIRDAFPDGQLYVDLQGSNPRCSPLEPAEALGRFIRALVPTKVDIPVDSGAAAGLFRSLVAERRLLVILDNAVDVAQVRPLLPGSDTCLVLVTSRRALTTLDEAAQLYLDVLGDKESLVMLGASAADRPAAEQLVALCGGLPLALRIVSARLAARSDWRMADLAQRLADDRHRLDELRTGDLEIRACFEVGYRSLDELGARAFRVVGFVRVPSFSVNAMAAALGVPVAAAGAALDQLVDARLIESSGHGYRVHDLLRLYAADLAQREDTPRYRERALRRMLVYYLSSVRRALAVLLGVWRPVSPELSGPEVELPPIDSVDDAKRWLASEWNCATAIAHQSVEAGPSGRKYAAQLLRSTGHYLARTYRWSDLSTLVSVVFATMDPDDLSSSAVAHGIVGQMQRRTGDIDAARDSYRRAFEAWGAVGDIDGMVATLNGAGNLELLAGNTGEAIQLYLDCRAIMGTAGNLQMQPFVLGNLAEAYLQRGDLSEAKHVQQQALRLTMPDPPPVLHMNALFTLGLISAAGRQHARSLRYFGRCGELAERLGDVFIQRDSLLCRAEVYLRLRRPDLATTDAHRVLGTFATGTDDPYRRAASLRILGRVAAAAGDTRTAHRLRREVEQLLRGLRGLFDPEVECFLAADAAWPRYAG